MPDLCSITSTKQSDESNIVQHVGAHLKSHIYLYSWMLRLDSKTEMSQISDVESVWSYLKSGEKEELVLLQFFVS